MPYKSEAQRKYFNSPAGKAKIGAEEVKHWNEVSKGMKLPKKLDDAIETCDKIITEQLSMFGPPVKGEEKKELKEYSLSYIIPGSPYRYHETVKAYSEDQAKTYLQKMLHKQGIHKVYDIRVD